MVIKKDFPGQKKKKKYKHFQILWYSQISVIQIPAGNFIWVGVEHLTVSGRATSVAAPLDVIMALKEKCVDALEDMRPWEKVTMSVRVL